MAGSLHIPHNHQLRLLAEVASWQPEVNQTPRVAPSYGSEYASYASSSTNWASSSSSATIFNRRYAGTAMDAYETSYDNNAISSAPHLYPPLWHCTPCGFNFPSLREHQHHHCPASQSLKRRRVDDDDEGDDEEQEESVDETERPLQRRRVTKAKTKSTATRKTKTTAKTKSKPRPKKPVPVKKNNAATVGTKGKPKAETETETTPLPAPLRVTRSTAARTAKDPLQAP